MMKNKILFVSVALNLIMVCLFCYIIIEKGGISFIEKKLGIRQVHEDNGFGPYYDQRKSLFAVLPKDTGDIIFLGHSLIDGCEWAELLNDPRIKNRGINGEQMKGVIKMLDVIMSPPPSKIFLMIGANDIGSGQSLNDMLSDFNRIVDTLNLHCPATEIYLIGLLPVGRNYDRQIGLIAQDFNDGLRKMSKENRCTFIDLFSLVKDKDGYLNDELSNDGTHLMGTGYVKIGKFLKGYLD